MASGHDEWVIRICSVLLGLAVVSDSEIKLSADGKVQRRKVYFAARSDGIVRIGSNMHVMNIKKRIK